GAQRVGLDHDLQIGKARVVRRLTEAVVVYESEIQDHGRGIVRIDEAVAVAVYEFIIRAAEERLSPGLRRLTNPAERSIRAGRTRCAVRHTDCENIVVVRYGIVVGIAGPYEVAGIAYDDRVIHYTTIDIHHGADIRSRGHAVSSRRGL